MGRNLASVGVGTGPTPSAGKPRRSPRGGCHTPRKPFVAADALPADPPDQSLADEPPEPPFVVTGEDDT